MKPDALILGFAGLMASGKDTACKYFTQKHGARSLGFSDCLRDIIDRIDLPANRTNLQQLSTVLRQTFGQDLLSRVVAADARRAGGQLIVVHGIRRPTDIVYLKKLPNFKMVAVEADDRKRYERLVSRGENVGDATKTWEAFLFEQQAEAEEAIPAVMAQADYHINNDGGQEDLHRKLEALYQSLISAS